MSAWNARPGVRSPDGRWYWDGRQWVPSGGPARVPPPPGPGRRPGPPPRRHGKSPVKFILLALGLIALLVVVGVGGLVLVALNGQGVVEVPFLPPSAHAVMPKPLQGTLRDAHVQIQLKDKQTGKVETQQGVITFSPKVALSETPSGGESFPTVVADGLEYENRADNGWIAQPESGTSPLGFLSWSLTDPEPGSLDHIVGQESTSDGLAWHLKDYSGNYEWWIRESDGFPIKAVNERAYVNVTYTFSQFNSGATVHVPRNIATDFVDGRPGQDVLIPGVAKVNVDQVHDHLSTGLFGGGAHGYRLIGVHVSYTYRGDRPTQVFPLDFPVTDSQGFVGIPEPTGSGGPSPAFPDASITPDQTVSGWLVIQVRDSATALTMQIGDLNAVGRIPLNLG